MLRAVVVLLIASFCANVSSNNDCIFTAIDILRGVRTINQVDQRQPPTPTSPTISRVATIDIETGVTTSSSSSVTITDFDRRPDNLVDFQRMYLNVKQHYEEKLQKLLRSTQLLLQNVQELQQQLTSISEKDESSQSRSSDALSAYDDGEGLIDWKKLPGTAVEISAKVREIWVINAAQNIFRWNGSDWELKPGTGVRLGSSPDGWTWMVNQRDQIFRWNVYTNNWDLMPGALMQISAISKESAMGVSRNNQIYVWTSGAWKRLPGGAIWAAIGVGDERWVVSSDQTIHRWNHATKSFDRIPGAAVNVDVHSPCRVIITNASNQMLIYKDNNWRLVNGAGTRSSINGTHIFTVNSAHEILIGN